MRRDGVLIVVSGFSGVGKGTLVKELVARYPEDYALSISATSRAPRTGEVDGREYFFITGPEFEEMIREDQLIEHATYNGKYYGTPKKYVDDRLSEGQSVILEIEVQGGLQIKEKFPETVLLYVLPPSAEELYRRLSGRGTETMENVRNRMNRAIEECDYVAKYDEVVVNDDFERCLSEIHTVLQKRRSDITSRREMVETLKSELISLSKGE